LLGKPADDVIVSPARYYWRRKNQDRGGGMESSGTAVRVDRIVLHIGTEKTGTSAIQHFLSKNRAALAADGFVYPEFTGPNGGSQWGFVAAIAQRPWRMDFGARLGIRDEASAANYRQRLLTAIDQELLACPGRHTLLLSCEHFHSRLRKPRRLEALKQLLSRWSDRVEVIVYLRRQDLVAVSHYSTQLKSGRSKPQVFPPVADGLPYYYDYERIYDNWCQVFDEQAVQAALYEQHNTAGDGLLSDFCSRAGILEEGKKRPARVNESLSEIGAALLREVNRQWPKQPLDGPNPSRELLVAGIAREHPGRCSPVTRSEAEAFYAHFVDSNARLAARAFPALSTALFAPDFSDYPETLPPPAGDLSAVVRDRIRNWQAASAADRTTGLGRRLLSVRQLFNDVPGRLKSLLGSARRPRQSAPPASASDLPPVFLHIGLPKTATTTLQNSLFSQHPGICYLGKRGGPVTEKHCSSEELYTVLRPLFWEQRETTRPELIRAVVGAYAAEHGPEKPVLGSWEGLGIKPHHHFKKMLREARDSFGDVRLILTLRNPLQRLPSAYLHALKSCAWYGKHHSIPAGRTFTTFDDWLAASHRLVKPHDYRFDFSDNLRFAVQLLGRDKVGVFLLEDMIEDREAFFAGILRFMGIDRLEAEQIENKHLNRALTAAQVAFLQALDADDEARCAWQALPNGKRRARMAEIAKSGVQEKYSIELTPDQRKLIEDKSHGLNRWLVETFGLDLQRHQYPL